MYLSPIRPWVLTEAIVSSVRTTPLSIFISTIAAKFSGFTLIAETRPTGTPAISTDEPALSPATFWKRAVTR